MSDLIIYNAKIFHKGKFIHNAGIAVDNGKISHINSTENILQLDAVKKIDLAGDIIAPGYIDPHTHGLLE